MNAGNNSPSALGNVRDKIDAIDEEIATLLASRFELVQEVKRVKGLTGEGDAPALRPAREAQILRRLVGKYGSRVHARTLISIWCEIMISATQVQAAFTVHRPTRGQASRLQDIVRLRFGSQGPVVEHVSVEEVVASVSTAVSDLGILPAPTGEDGFAQLPADGLRALLDAGDDDVRIIASLPMWADEKQTGAWIVGKSLFDPSGDDATIFCTVDSEAGGQAPEDRLVFDGVEFDVAHAGYVETQAGRWSVNVVAGYVPQSDEGIAALQTYAGDAVVRHLGGFPSAIEIGEKV